MNPFRRTVGNEPVEATLKLARRAHGRCASHSGLVFGYTGRDWEVFKESAADYRSRLSAAKQRGVTYEHVQVALREAAPSRELYERL
jgi:CHAD domain-containing protein